MSKHVLHNEFTAISERDEEWYIGYCPEIPGANGQGKNIEECKKNLADAIALILQDRREDAARGLPADAAQDIISISWNGMHCSGICGSTTVYSNVKVTLKSSHEPSDWRCRSHPKTFGNPQSTRSEDLSVSLCSRNRVIYCPQ